MLKSASRSAPYQSPVESRRTVTFSADTSQHYSGSPDSIDFWGDNINNTANHFNDDGKFQKRFIALNQKY